MDILVYSLLVPDIADNEVEANSWGKSQVLQTAEAAEAGPGDPAVPVRVIMQWRSYFTVDDQQDYNSQDIWC